jgi:hypothetical protein
MIGRIPWAGQDHIGPPERHRVQYRLFSMAVEGSTGQSAPGERMQLVRPFKELLPGHALHPLSGDDDRDLLVALPQLLKDGQAAFGLGLRDDLIVGGQPPLKRSPQCIERLAVIFD